MDAACCSQQAHLVLWQLISVLLTGTGYFSQRLASIGVDAPTAQSAIVYVLLSLHALPLVLSSFRRRRHRLAQGPSSGATGGPGASCTDADASRRAALRWWQWLLVAAADVEANYLLVCAYQFTDITSVCILDAFSVPTVMGLSAALRGVRYSRQQVVAAGLCLAGIVALFASDLAHSAGEQQGAPRRAWVGDALVLAGAALYGCSNVAQEHLLRRVVPRTEYLANLGAYGGLVAIVQSVMLEREALADAWHAARRQGGAGVAELVALETGFVISLLGFYLLVAILLERGSTATLMNLSLLTSDFWAVAVGVTLLHSTPGFIYPIAFALVVGGLVLYHCGGAEHGAQHLAAHREPLVGRRPQSDGCNGSEPLCTPCSGDAPAGDTPWVGGALAVNVSRR